MNIRSVILAVATAAAAGGVLGDEVAGAGSKGMAVGVLDPLALENACPCVEGYAQRQYGKLAEHISRSLGKPVTVEFGTTVETIANKFGRTPDVVFGIRSAVELQAAEKGRRLTFLGMLTDKEGKTDFHGLFIARSKSNIATLADLKDKKIVFGPVDRLEKHRLALEALAKVGVPAPEKPAVTETCNQGAVAVVSEEADAAVISSYALPIIYGCKSVAPNELKVVGRTADLPFVAVFASGALPAETVAALRKALLSVGQNRELLKQMESKRGFDLGSPEKSDGPK